MTLRDRTVKALCVGLLHLASGKYRRDVHRLLADGHAYQLGVSTENRPERP